MPDADRVSWTQGVIRVVAVSIWRRLAADPLRLFLALLVGLLMSSGDALPELRAYTGIVALVGFLNPRWSWRLAALSGLVPHVLGGMGVGPMSCMDVALPVMPGFFAALIACWLGGRYESFHRRRLQQMA